MFTQLEPNATPKNRAAHMRCLDCANGLFVGDIDEKCSLNLTIICKECGHGHVIEMHAIEEF